MAIVCNCDNDCAVAKHCPKRAMEVTPIADVYNFTERVATRKDVDHDEMEIRYRELQRKKTSDVKNEKDTILFNWFT